MVDMARSQANPAEAGQEDDAPLTLKERALIQLAWTGRQLRKPVVLMGVFLLAYLPFGALYMNSFQKETELNDRIAAKRTVLDVPAVNLAQIESTLQNWTVARDTASRLRVEGLLDSALVNAVLEIAAETGVTVFSAGTDDPAKEVIDDEAYAVTPLLLRATGDLPTIERFVEELESGRIEALEVRSSLIASSDFGYILTLRAVTFSQSGRVLEDEEESDESDKQAAARLTQNPGGAR